MTRFNSDARRHTLSLIPQALLSYPRQRGSDGFNLELSTTKNDLEAFLDCLGCELSTRNKLRMLTSAALLQIILEIPREPTLS